MKYHIMYYKVVDLEAVDNELLLVRNINHLLPITVHRINDPNKRMLYIEPIRRNQLIYTRNGVRITDIGYEPITRDNISKIERDQFYS